MGCDLGNPNLGIGVLWFKDSPFIFSADRIKTCSFMLGFLIWLSAIGVNSFCVSCFGSLVFLFGKYYNLTYLFWFLYILPSDIRFDVNYTALGKLSQVIMVFPIQFLLWWSFMNWNNMSSFRFPTIWFLLSYFRTYMLSFETFYIPHQCIAQRQFSIPLWQNIGQSIIVSITRALSRYYLKC